MATITASSLVHIVRTRAVVQTNDVVSRFLFTSQQFLGICPISVLDKEISLCLRTQFVHQGSPINLDSEWVDPVRFRVSRTPAFASQSGDAKLAICTLSVSRSVNHD